MQSPPYIVFPIEVVSNTHDFDVRYVIHCNRKMRGVFARRAINEAECALFIGVYPGLMRTQEEARRKAAQYAERHFMERRAAAGKANTYSLWHRHYDSDHVLDPTDEEGNLLAEFTSYVACYVNEPPPGCFPNSAFVHNRPRHRCEIWLIAPIGQDQEVFIYYGGNYVRNYPISDQASGHRPSYYIPDDVGFELDRRAPPPVLQLPT